MSETAPPAKCERPECDQHPESVVVVNGIRVCTLTACIDWAMAQAMKPLNGGIQSLRRT